MQTLRNLGATRLVALAAVGFALVAFFVFIVTRLATPGMTLLYSGLDPSDSGQIVQRMDAQGIPYELRGDGSQIYVPQDQVARLRLSLASEGIPSGGSIGYEIFDRADALGTTNFVQQINQIRALEGELSRTIRSINQVRSARVHLVMPKRELFSRDRAEPTASVVLALQGSLDKGQVSAIQHLVSSAVPGMRSKNVSVIDNNGELLARGADEGALDTANSEDMRRSYEARLSQSIEQLLAQTLGAGKVRAEVTADLDFNQVTTNKEDFNPDGQVVRSTNSIEETGTTQERQGANNVSVANNTPNPPGQDCQRLHRLQLAERPHRGDHQLRDLQDRPHRGEGRRRSEAHLGRGAGRRRHHRRRGRHQDLRRAHARGARADRCAGEVGDRLRRGPRRRRAGHQHEVRRAGDRRGRRHAARLRQGRSDAPRRAGRAGGRGAAGPAAGGAPAAGPHPGDAGASRPPMSRWPVPASSSRLPPGAAAALAIPGPAQTQLPSIPSASDAEQIAAEIDQMIDLNQVEGRVRASSVRKISDLVDQHPEQAVNLIRQWVYQEQ